MYKPYIVSAPHNLGPIAAAHFCGAITSANKEVPNVVLPTGGTPQGMYDVLRKNSAPLNFRYFQLDEYWGIEQTDPRSYAKEILDNALTSLNIGEDLHVTFNTAHGEGKAEAQSARMERAILDFGGIDIAVLGIGPNGHIGFNEPGTAFDSTTHLVTLAEGTKRANAPYCDPYGGVPEQAITLGIRTILEAKRIILLAREGKEDIMERAFMNDITTDVPASALRQHPNVTIIASPVVTERLER